MYSQGPAHRYPPSFESTTFSFSVLLYLMITITENGAFQKRFSVWNFLKRLFSSVRVDGQRRNLSKKLTSHYLFQFTLRAHNSEYVCVKQAQSGYRLKIIVFKSIHCKRVDRPKQCEIATCGPEFFWKRRKKSCVLKRIRIREDRA